MKRAGWESWLLLAIPLSLAVLVFARAASFPFVNWDDPSHFADNPLTAHPLARGLRGLFLTREIGYPAPLLLLSFSLDRVLWGTHPGPYHLENLLLHLANLAMLFRLARRIGLRPIEACGAVTLFAVHPLVVEPVCWVTGRKDLLSTALVLGAALIAAGSDRREGLGAPWRWAIANVLVVLAVLVLPRAVVASILVVVLVHAARPDWALRRVAIRMTGALLVAILVVVAGARQLSALGGVPPSRTLTNVAADIGAVWALQLSHLLFPIDLLAYYFREPGDPPLWAMIAAALGAIFALGLVATRTKPGSPVRTGAALAVLAYGPVSGLFVIRRWTADSYMYVPLAAISLAVVPAIVRAWPPALARFGVYASSALGALLALLSLMGSSRWSSSTNVWAGSIARYPMEPLSYEHEALGLLFDRRTAEANPLFIQIAERFPDWKDTLDDEVRAYEAAGDPRRAAVVLAHGVRMGSPACVRMYWMRLLSSPRLPDPGQRDLIALAFDAGYGDMKEGLRDPVAFRRVVGLLEAVGLNDRATQAREHAAELERAPR